ncbi:MAG: hypothetical protein ACJAZO_003208 [Myxococcota bacterium]|jgi:hypothetical protein
MWRQGQVLRILVPTVIVSLLGFLLGTALGALLSLMSPHVGEAMLDESGERPGPARIVAMEAVVDAVAVDPSELVRCRFVEALLPSDRPEWHQLTRHFASDDRAGSVRAVLTLGHAPPILDGAAPEVVDLGPDDVRELRLRAGETPRQLATALRPLARSGRGFALETLSGNRIRVTRGTRRVPRLWRLVDALRHPDPGRRQG